MPKMASSQPQLMRNAIVLFMLVYVALAYDCECEIGENCCVLQGERTCVSREQFICSVEAPFVACSVQQCPLPLDNTLCRVGKHRYFYCTGDKCCATNNITAAFIQPAELTNPDPRDVHYFTPRIIQAIFIFVSFIALLLTRKWNYVRTKNLYVQGIDLIAHCFILRYVLSPQITDSCYIRHLFDGMGIYLFIWNSKIFHVYFRSQAYKLEQNKKKLIFSKKLDAISNLINRENRVEFLLSAKVALMLAAISISIGMTAIHFLTDIRPSESATCINPQTTVGAMGVSLSIGSIFALAFITVACNNALDAYSTKWETYACLMSRVAASLLTQMIFWVFHMGLNRSTAIVSSGSTYTPYRLQKWVMWGGSSLDIFVNVWIPILFQIRENLRVKELTKLQKQDLDHDDVFVSSLANFATREYSVDAVLYWKMIRKIQESRNTALAISFVDLFLKRVPKFSHVDVQWCLESMHNVNDVLNEEYLETAEERLRTRYLEPMVERMIHSDEIVPKTMVTAKLI